MSKLVRSLLVPIALLAALGCSRKDAGETPLASAEPLVSAAAAPAESPKTGGDMWGASYFPNIELVTHEGKKVHFYDDLVKDKVVAINFIYTSCPDACPMETARLVEVQKLLGDRLGKDIYFYSISIDPKHDTPEVLKEYAEKWHTAPGWTFLTGNEDDIIALRKKLGVYDAEATRTDHSISMVIGNQKTGRWMKRSPYENPYVLANQLGSWLHNWKLPSEDRRDYADAPPVRNIGAGEEMFRARCAACHTVGGGEKREVDEHRVGPDLLHVEKRRDKKWLDSWMMRPDQMLKDKDPIATKLFTEYNEIVMPNFRLTKSEVDNLLGYIAEESASADYRAELTKAASAASKVEAPKAEASPLATMGPVAAAALPAVDKGLGAYESMRERFAADDLKGAVAHVKALGEAFEKAAPDAGEAKAGLLEIATRAKAVGEAKDIAAARLAFGELSRRVVALFVANPSLQKGHFLFLCPMASGYQKWVQTSATLTNPYWGSQMLHCGRELKTWEI